jgi:hypothetical protein
MSGSLPDTASNNTRESKLVQETFRQAAEKHRLAACALHFIVDLVREHRRE